jgi:truncated hemoglobin YjbI
MNATTQPLCKALSRDQVAAVVSHFYQMALSDELLAPYFNAINDWPEHERYITDFWWGVMGGEVAEPRPGAMISGHQGLAITAEAMQRWLALFGESVDALVPQAEAQQWHTIARHIATMMGEHGLIEKED